MCFEIEKRIKKYRKRSYCYGEIFCREHPQ